MTLGTDDKVRTEEVKFYVVDLESPYNANLGMPFHAAFDIVVSMSHQRVKFNTCQGIGMTKSDPKVVFDRMITIRRNKYGDVENSECMEIRMIMTISDNSSLDVEMGQPGVESSK